MNSKLFDDTDKEALQAQINRLSAKLRKIEDAERQERNRELVGRCFKYRNSYGGHRPSWPLYTRILAVNGPYLVALRFETDCDGHVNIEPNERVYNNCLLAESDEITIKEFRDAWRRAVNRVTSLNAAALK